MKIEIISPTESVVKKYSKEEIERLKKSLTYKNTSVQFLISKHRDNRFWKSRNYDTWEWRMSELKSQLTDCLLKERNGVYHLKPGVIPYIQEKELKIENKVEYKPFSPIPWKKNIEFTPYDYQTKSVENLMSQKHGNISLPTGAGKSLILLLLSQKMGLNTVIVTPSKSIFNELLSEFTERLGKKYVGGYGDGKKDIKKKITIAIGKSLTMLKEGSEAYDFFSKKDAVLVDESHTFAADQLEKVCHGVMKDIPYRFFVSATQTRGDGTELLLKSIIGKNVLNKTIEQAIKEKYLTPLKFFVASLKSPNKSNYKDPLKTKRNHFLYNENIAKFYSKIANASWKVKQESTLILVEELQQIEMLTRYLKVPYAYVHSGSKKEAEKWGLEKVNLQEQVDKFNKGEVRVLIGTRSISTGTNMYPTHNTCNWMGGSSEIITKQGPMGRSTRKLEISKYKEYHKEKPYSKIWDVDVEDQPILERHLLKRISYYKETGEDINFIKNL